MPATIIVHGGAGDWPDDEDDEKAQALEEALRVGLASLNAGHHALDAVERAVNILEDHPLFDAGIGSHLNSAGFVEMDALIVDGTTHDFGAVAAVQRVQYPITLARRVMTHTQHKFIVGPGAEDLAEHLGIPLIENTHLITEAQRVAYAQKRPNRQTSDTVGAVAIDEAGNIASATSTGGVFLKWPGRVGDSPMFGAGGYADSRYGGASATGVGENSMRVLLSHYGVSRLSMGQNAQQAADDAMKYISTFFDDSQVGIILLDAQGGPGAAHTTTKLACGWLIHDQQPRTSMRGGIVTGQHP